MGWTNVTALIHLCVAVSWDLSFSRLLLNKFLKSSNENDYGDDEQTEDESSHDDDQDTDGASGTNKVELNLRVLVIEVHTIHGDGHLHALLADVRWVILNIWGQAKDMSLVDVGSC